MRGERNDTAPSRPDVDLRVLADVASRLSFWKGMEIGVQGEPCTHLYLLVRGQVLMSRRSLSGGDYALHLLGPGDLFGEGSLRPHRRWMATIRAVTDGEAYALPAAHLPRVGQYYPQLMGKILSLLSGGVERAHRRLDLISTNSAHERISRLLVLMAENHGERHGDEVRVPLGLTQTELGDMVGLARETVARVFSDLEAQHLIRRQGRRAVWVRSASAHAGLSDL